MFLQKVLAIAFIAFFGNYVLAKNMALETNEVMDYTHPSKINFLFDMFLKVYTKKLIEENQTQIAVQGFKEEFSYKMLTLLIEGAFIVEDGLAGNISTLQRTGDAEMDRDGGVFYVSAHLGLADLQIHFKDYDISFLGAHQKGEIHATVGKNSLYLKIRMELEPKCNVSLVDLKIEELDNIDVDITNLGIFEDMTDDIISWVVKEVTEFYRHYVEDELYPELNAAVKNANLCHYIPH